MNTIDLLFGTEQETRTLNGALTNASTNNAVLDFFSRAGGMRGQDKNIVDLFAQAYVSNPKLARKALFWLRDIRGGAGERELFRDCLKWLAVNDPLALKVNLDNIAEYGRYDDLVILLDVQSVANTISTYLYQQFIKDRASERPSLLAKWLPSENASSKASRYRARLLQRNWNMKPRDYRRQVTKLRYQLSLVETNLTTKNYDNIKYDSVPSQAMRIHGRKGKAFLTRDNYRFTTYLEQVRNGVKTIKAGTLYPYQLVANYLGLHGGNGLDKTIEAQWKALPNYLETNPHNGLVVCDVSGSMYSGINKNIRPIDIAVSLAIYFAERSKGMAQNRFVTFSERPQLQDLRGNTLYDKVQNLVKAEWGMSTNIQSVFDLLLSNATRNRLAQSDMPDVLYIVSDMEFNQATGNNYVRKERTNLDVIRTKYEQAGYKLPVLVFWNVNAKTQQSPAKKNDQGIVLISGASPAILKALLSEGVDSLLGITPEWAMLQVLNSERYQAVK